ncbi:S8 family peptidase [Actinomarinicola tropica]|uniref:S8 family serine peptidase n=1 Tax=Actinomarinicola tropica TaxID=2789776 RepID=A0A5Q2RHS2_9ACTN|nr:S8 family serine peptidase [Actinomarinicola tropica]QGG96408.1 S8 family serine peptidase [Actinomarinicola tropica]
MAARSRPGAWRRRALALAALALPGLLGPAAVPAAAQSPVPTGSFIVLMAADPAASYSGDVAGLAATDPAPGEELDPDAPEVQAYVDHLADEQDDAQAAAGVADAAVGQTYTYALNGFEAQLSEDQVVALERQPQVARVVPNTLRQLTTDNSTDFLGLEGRRGVYASGYTGEDVVVGVIDSGIWPEHPSFADDGSYAPLPGFEDLACDVGATEHNPQDAPFDCNQKLLGAYDMRITYKQAIGPEVYDSARDYDGHGTHTASTAAGNADVRAEIFGLRRGTVTGVAPRARVVAYSACGELGCVTSDLVAAIEQAVIDGVDVINYSIGGGASLTDPADMAFLAAADANVWVATSAGNDGPGPETMGGPATVPWVTSVGASTQDRTFGALLWFGTFNLTFGASVTPGTPGRLALVDAEDLGNALCDPAVGFQGQVTGAIVLCARGAVARVAKSQAVADAGGAGMILYNEDDAQALVTDNHFVPSVHVDNSTGLQIKAYIDRWGRWSRAMIFQSVRLPDQGSVMADFSSRGSNPIAPDIIKPDVTAPGVNILAGNTPTPTIGAPGQLFQSISGTSMSSPHVAGLFALLRQAHPDWTAAMAKSALMTTARQDVVEEDGATPADPFDMGAGHVDPSGRPTAAGSPFNPGLVYDAGYLDYLGFLCDADPAIFVDPQAACPFLESLGVPLQATDLNVPSIGVASVAGTQTVTRRVTSVAGESVTYTPQVEAPAGYAVHVEPAQLQLAPGETGTYSVTFTNQGAPIGEWRFGALTWRGGGYDVRSPIAVRAALFEAPEAVQATGTAGTAEIPITFGYSGPYAASAHGPVPAELLAGSVGQDPDQTFDPTDTEGVLALPVDLAGVAFLRLALDEGDLVDPPEGVDLDLFLVDGTGAVVAESTSGGTNELIELAGPADGSYTLYVHGWQTFGEEVELAVRSWAVPAEPGTGTLSIVDAPAAAVLGETGTITVEWSGLDVGTEYLGVVAHADGSGLVGLTLVEIATG